MARNGHRASRMLQRAMQNGNRNAPDHDVVEGEDEHGTLRTQVTPLLQKRIKDAVCILCDFCENPHEERVM